ncbi:hypothetical protein C0991_005424 [Blastosporella zonata]|nr:hypothetical protein C0991_005424 [Blastosporella zonata]
MGQLVAQERPIDAPTPSVYIKMVEAKLLLPGSDSTSCRRVLDIIRGWKEDATHKNIKHDVEEIAMALRTHSKLIRDLNAVLPLEYIVQCPTAVDALEYMVLITSDGGQILSTSGQVSAAVPFPSSTQELRTVLPLKDEWESIKERCLTDSQWGSCLSQLLQVEFDNPKIDNDYKRVISRRQMHLAKKTATLPPSLFLHNVELPGNTYHCESGGFADIAKATINGTPVCLKILREYSDKQDDRVKKGKCSEISSGLSYLHGLSIHHKDINAANVLVKDDEHCCLADFGLSSIAGSQRLESKSYAGEGTCRWKALELIASDVEEIYVALDFGAADVWAFACTVSEIYTGNIPFKHIKEDISVGLAILNGKKPELPGAGTHGISEGFRNLVWSCWDEAPERRPMLSEINDFLKSEIASCDAPAMVNPQPIGEDFEEHDVDTTDPFQVMEQSVTMDELSGGHSSKLPNDYLPLRRISSAAGGLHDRQSSKNHISWDPPRGLKIEVPNPTSASSGSAVKAIGGLLTPTTNHNSPVALASLLTGLEALAEEPSAINYMDQPGSTLPGICTAAKMLTPPETPVMLPETQSPQLTPSPTRLSPLSPVFWPGPGVRIKTHRLSLEAAVFQPSHEKCSVRFKFEREPVVISKLLAKLVNLPYFVQDTFAGASVGHVYPVLEFLALGACQSQKCDVLGWWTRAGGAFKENADGL